MPDTTTPAPPTLNTLRIDLDGEIGTLTLNRPDRLNALSPEMIGELVLAASWLADSAQLRALIVTGDGRAFSAGGDVTWFKRGIDDEGHDLPADVRRAAEVLHQAIVDFRRIPYPVVAAVNGVAAGAGFSLALMCDTRIASEEAAFVCAYGRIGASPDGGMTYFLPRIIGPSRAVELLLNDPMLSAQQALEAGLVAEVVPADRLAARAREKAEKLAAKAPHYVRMCKRLVGESLDHSLAEHLQLERDGIAGDRRPA
jgi:2-(1,2-epoxy-1,2-dihydrophenyl)acetyl-CoA isomerase